ncbi:glutamine amidotransferase class II-like protein [Paraburkholderia sp. RAU2J]|nr:glutamine amidotransferase class II-like protein [Paraburkholderia sp. RAU2J]
MAAKPSGCMGTITAKAVTAGVRVLRNGLRTKPHMCQLLALSCAEPTDVSFSLTGFAARGGLADHHVDGWGVAFYEATKSRNVVAHIRKATQDGARVENCYPFMRELRGQQWVFAHNGDLQPLGEQEPGHPPSYPLLSRRDFAPRVSCEGMTLSAGVFWLESRRYPPGTGDCRKPSHALIACVK